MTSNIKGYDNTGGMVTRGDDSEIDSQFGRVVYVQA
jgi:hypothetical protein